MKQVGKPCVNNSEYKTCIERKNIYVGFIHVERLESRTAKKSWKKGKETDNTPARRTSSGVWTPAWNN